MEARTFIPELGHATTCTGYGADVSTHRPQPLRFVWHHLRPESLGGASDSINCVQVCDLCHYATHALLYWMSQHNGILPAGYGTLAQRRYAQTGWNLTPPELRSQIPNEGSIL